MTTTSTTLALVGSDYYRAFAQQAQFSEFDLLRDAFAARSVRLECVDAYDPAVRWDRYAAVLPLGFWGYHKDGPAFLRWLGQLEGQGTRLLNPPAVLRWNMDKSYLLDLARAGVDVAPVLHFPVGSAPDLAAELSRVGWDRYVLKPAISANSEHTRVGHGPPDRDLLDLAARILTRCGLLLQPFFPEIPQTGEWSLIVAGDTLLHAVCKLPKAGDFRSQPDHGGTVSRATPTPALAAQTLSIVQAAARLHGPLTYARVDGFLRDGKLHLIELELIEPYLFMQGAGPDSPRRFCAAVLAQLPA